MKDADRDILVDLPCALRDPNSYPAGIHAVEWLETTSSWVILAQNFIYKVRRPTDDDWVGALSLDRLRRSLEEEMRLKGPLARGAYIGVVPVTRTEEGSLQVEGEGQPVAWAVKMWRHSKRRTVDRFVERGEITETLLDAVAETLLSEHQQPRLEASLTDHESKFVLRSRVERVGEFLASGGFLLQQLSGGGEPQPLTALLAHFSSYFRAAHPEQGVGKLGHLLAKSCGVLGAAISPADMVVSKSGRAAIPRSSASEKMRLADVAEDLAGIARLLSNYGRRASAHTLVQHYEQLSSDTSLWARVCFYACLESLEQSIEAKEKGHRLQGILTPLLEAFSWSSAASVLLLDSESDAEAGTAQLTNSQLPSGLKGACAQALHYGLMENLSWDPEERIADLVLAQADRGFGIVIGRADLTESDRKSLMTEALRRGHLVLVVRCRNGAGSKASPAATSGLTLELPGAMELDDAILQIVECLARPELWPAQEHCGDADALA